MKKILLVVIFLTAIHQNTVYAQRTCGSELNIEQIRQTDPVRYQRFLQLEQHTEQFKKSLQGGPVNGRLTNPNSTVIIPVVVHIIHNPGEAIGVGRNLSVAQIQSQIDVLNEDFRRLNADRINTPALFFGIAADPNFEFRLACVDPSGNPTNGITRTASTTVFTQAADNIKFNSTGGHDAWATNRYLNIWVGNLAGGLLGYSSWPADFASSPNRDGVVIRTTAFGREGNVVAPYHQGRTATHEIGHWLNLIHIWGDDGGSCSGSDQVNDTPNQANLYYGCPTFPSPSCGNTSDMFMNYMDYTDDGCMNLFTAGQTTRMRAVFASGGPRYSFINNYFKINPGPDAICSTGATLSVYNPNCLAVTWTIVSGPVSILSGQGTNTITLTSTGNGVATIRATAGGYTDEITLQAGIQTPTNIVGLVPPLGVSPGELLELEAAETAPGYLWDVQGGTILGYNNQKQVLIQAAYCPPNLYNGWLNVQLYYINSCGTGSYGEYTTIDCGTGGGVFLLSPNPANGQVTISSKDKEVRELQIIDKNGNLRKQQRFTAQGRSVRLDIVGLPPDIYTVRIFDGKTWVAKKLIVR